MSRHARSAGFALHGFAANQGFPGYTYDRIAPWIDGVDLRHADAVMGERDVEIVEWPGRFRLTEAASARVLAHGERELSMFGHLRRFIASLDGEKLYGGIGISPFSAMGMGFPVLLTSVQCGRVEIVIRASLVASPGAEARVEVARLREHLGRAGLLATEPLPPLPLP